VFVDTSAFYALLDRADQYHDVVQTIYGGLARDRRDLVTTNFVLLELHSLITNRMSAQVATSALFRIDAGETIIVRGTEDDEAHARDILRQYTDKGFSLLDATSFAVMERLGIDTALSFDKHFAQYRWTVLG